jgi:hypothetical protein
MGDSFKIADYECISMEISEPMEQGNVKGLGD